MNGRPAGHAIAKGAARPHRRSRDDLPLAGGMSSTALLSGLFLAMAGDLTAIIFE
jgi:hypothetical protein